MQLQKNPNIPPIHQLNIINKKANKISIKISIFRLIPINLFNAFSITKVWNPITKTITITAPTKLPILSIITQDKQKLTNSVTKLLRKSSLSKSKTLK